jgi:serine/threonine-protein kinase
MEDLTGTILLEKYRIDGLLGQGGMGSVFRGEHIRTGRKVAVKLLDERFLGNPSVVQRFGREARAASAIQHPGIVEVLDLDQTKEGIPFLVMELLPGYALSSRINQKTRLGLDETMDIMGQLLEALDAAHDHGVIHRDLKPDNIILTPRKRRSQMLKILDFGISQKSDESAANLTVAGTVLGTPHYMAPEQALGDSAIDRRADLYAAGIVMYECLTGDVPFDADNYNALIYVILNKEPTPPRDRGAGMGPALERALLRCLSKDKEARPSTASEMLQLLRDARNRDELEPPTTGNGSKPILRVPAAIGSDPQNAKVSSGSAIPTVAAARAMSAPTSRSLADGDLVIAPTTPRRSKRPVATSATPPRDDDDFDPFMEAGDHAADLQLDDSVVDTRGSLRPSLRSRSTVPVGPRSSHNTPRPDVSTRPPPEARKSPVLVYALGVVLVVLGLFFAARMFLASTDEVPVANTIDETEHHPEDPEPESTSPDGRVTIDVTGLPPGASVRLDGLPTGTLPLRLRQGSAHTLAISAPGYEAREIRFTADEDKRLRGNLRPGTGAVP